MTLNIKHSQFVFWKFKKVFILKAKMTEQKRRSLIYLKWRLFESDKDLCILQIYQTYYKHYKSFTSMSGCCQHFNDIRYLLIGGEVWICTSGTKTNSRYLMNIDRSRFQCPPTTRARKPPKMRWKASSNQQMNRPLRLTALVMFRFLMTFWSRIPAMRLLLWTVRWWNIMM